MSPGSCVIVYWSLVNGNVKECVLCLNLLTESTIVTTKRLRVISGIDHSSVYAVVVSSNSHIFARIKPDTVIGDGITIMKPLPL